MIFTETIAQFSAPDLRGNKVRLAQRDKRVLPVDSALKAIKASKVLLALVSKVKKVT